MSRLPIVLALMACALPTVSAVPMDEVRSLLRERALHAPSAAALAALSEAKLASTLSTFDRHARHFAADDYRSPRLGREASTGIGADLVHHGDGFVLDVYQGGAADRAGVPDRARLVEIDGVAVAGLSPALVASRLRGEAGSRVALVLGSTDGRRSIVHIQRERHVPLDVEWVQPGAGPVLRLRQFVAGLTRAALLATLDFGRGQHGMTEGQPLLIDLRNAPGGDLYEAFDMAGLFLPAGTLLGTLRTRASRGSEVRTGPGPKFDMPLVLLIGPDTASAAEVFAGALHRQGRAVLVGRRSYGKCSSQTDARLSDGSVLRFTNREVLLPDGTSCSGVGLTPDHEVPPALLADLPGLVARAYGLAETR